MNIKSKIKSLIKEADLYNSQGLLAEAKDIFENALKIIQTRLPYQEGINISKAIKSKIASIEKEIARVEKKVLSPDMSKESQDLITKMFKQGKGEEDHKALLDGAKALIKFGQFDRAIEELQKLIPIDEVRADAAKHILNCYFLRSKYESALEEYKKWCSDLNFSDIELDGLRGFMQKTFKAKGVDKEIPIRDAGDDDDFEEFDIMASIKKTEESKKNQ